MPRERSVANDQVRAIRVVHISHRLPLAIVVEGHDGELYHAVLARDGQQLDLCASTWICGIAASSIGLSMNSQSTVILPHQLIQDLASAAHLDQDGIAVGDSTTVLADRISGPRSGPLRPFSFLPQSSAKYVKNKQDFIGMYLFDIWVEHGVARRVLFNRTGRSSDIRARFVNDGSVLAGQQYACQATIDSLYRQPPSLYENLWSNAQSGIWLDLFRRQIPEALDWAISSMPTVWRSHVKYLTLCQGLTDRLDALETLARAYPLPDAAFWSTDADPQGGRREGASAIA